MSFTKRFTVTDTWQPVTTAGASGLAQIQQDGPCYVHLGATQPAVDSTDWVTLYGDGLEEIAFSGVEGTDIVFARSADGDTVELSVMATGSAPA